MATTGFWPIKGSLKDLVKYADNPDKTTNPKYLDTDLAAALKYVENDDKTDMKMFVSGINCPTVRAYEQMMITKRRYGKMGGNVAYHGYQSFKIDEVTPEEAHKIGIETAKRMWGKDYEIVVTTHLNTENIHNHIVINSVSFKTGLKFENHIKDHIRLREISDDVCREFGKSVLENAKFYKSDKKLYAAQTSKKIRAVWQMKAANGERVSSTVPYGYMKSPDDKKKWIIDEEAAEVVRKIFALSLAGRGVLQIAKQLEEEKILIPTAYKMQKGLSVTHKNFANPYYWDQKTIAGILDNRQYTGCTVNFKSTTISYKVHKVIHKPEEEYQIIPDTQEAIISEDLWLRVQELRKNKRRPTATGRTSLFSGLVYCPDCGAKLHFAAAKSLTRQQEHFRCSNYKSGRGECTVHYIRDIVLERIVFEAISNLADFVRCYEPVFLYLMADKNQTTRKSELQKLKTKVENGKRRISELDLIISRIYEDNILGKISDERYSRMASMYENEQKELIETISNGEKELEKAEQQNIDMRLLLKTLRELTDFRELTPTIVNSLIQRIEVHNNDKYDGHCHVKVDIYFTAVGMIDIPDEKEILDIIEKIQENPQMYKVG